MDTWPSCRRFGDLRRWAMLATRGVGSDSPMRRTLAWVNRTAPVFVVTTRAAVVMTATFCWRCRPGTLFIRVERDSSPKLVVRPRRRLTRGRRHTVAAFSSWAPLRGGRGIGWFQVCQLFRRVRSPRGLRRRSANWRSPTISEKPSCRLSLIGGLTFNASCVPDRDYFIVPSVRANHSGWLSWCRLDISRALRTFLRWGKPITDGKDGHKARWRWCIALRDFSGGCLLAGPD